MIFYILTVLILLKVYFLTRYFSRRKVHNCFTAENFDKVVEYTKWKQNTSKIGKVLVDGYRVEVSSENELLFRKDNNEHYTLFKISREDGVLLLALKNESSLLRKANNIFCELLKRAVFHPVNPAS